MSADLNAANIPTSIQGRKSEKPGGYGEAASRRYRQVLAKAQDEFVRTGSPHALDAANQTSIRYAPQGSIIKGNITRVGVENAIGYARAEVKEADKNGDGAVDLEELGAHLCGDGCDHQIGQIDDPEHAGLAAQVTRLKTANLMASTDVNGDRKITADEMAAKVLFDDTALQMFDDNSEVYQSLIGSLESKSDYDGPSFDALKAKVTDIKDARKGPYQLDGRLTGGEREIADALTDTPIPTGEIVGGIHRELDLKALTGDFVP